MIMVAALTRKAGRILPYPLPSSVRDYILWYVLFLVTHRLAMTAGLDNFTLIVCIANHEKSYDKQGGR